MCVEGRAEEAADTVIETINQLAQEDLWAEIDDVLVNLKKDIEFFKEAFVNVLLSFLNSTVCFKTFLREYEDLRNLIFNELKNSACFSSEMIVI